ncbi:hypothetical protein O9G_005725 [Rozella allomycis CSF55]|uniref:Uncharacterized protein n=1 Tax=Rozella allomycis (strain CSF55) TaxID=988480 RepID=A0A075ASW6_ROZAC|nr:hypothetical protein O9G_005725 [Rozella allomycis CSF55]|eukprot:EPZ33363.1 hypothetical protein O9G_005725 [Rozella allomycis CSF55]
MPKPDLLRRRRKSLPMRSPKSAFDVYDTPGVVFTCDSSSIKVKHKPLDFTTEYRSALDSSSSPELFPVCDENAISNERKNAGHRQCVLVVGHRIGEKRGMVTFCAMHAGCGMRNLRKDVENAITFPEKTTNVTRTAPFAGLNGFDNSIYHKNKIIYLF